MQRDGERKCRVSEQDKGIERWRVGGNEKKKKGETKTVTGHRAYRDKKRTGNRTKGLRNKERVISAQRDQEKQNQNQNHPTNQQWARGQRQRKTKKGQGVRQTRRESKKKRETQLDREV